MLTLQFVLDEERVHLFGKVKIVVIRTIGSKYFIFMGNE